MIDFSGGDIMNQKIRLKIGENEIELEGGEKFVNKHLKLFIDKYSEIEAVAAKKEATAAQSRAQLPAEKSRKPLSPAEFVRQKNPSSGTEKIIVLAKYLEDYRSLSEFSNKDINKVAKEAKLGHIDNSYYAMGLKQGYLNKIQYGKYQLTLTGEDAVLALSQPSK